MHDTVIMWYQRVWNCTDWALSVQYTMHVYVYNHYLHSYGYAMHIRECIVKQECVRVLLYTTVYIHKRRGKVMWYVYTGSA